MPKDLSPELSLIYWEAWFLEECNKVPVGTDSWNVHCLDTLQMYTAGGEL